MCAGSLSLTLEEISGRRNLEMKGEILANNSIPLILRLDPKSAARANSQNLKN
jgi:hypothetical protein